MAKHPYLLTLFLCISTTLAAQNTQQTNITTAQEIISVEPYLQNPLDNGITIIWQTTVPAYCKVEYVECDSILSGYKIARNLVNGQVICNNTVHRVRIENLKPGKKYSYRVYATEILEYQAYKKVFGASDSTQFYEFELPSLGTKDFTAVVFNDLHKQGETVQALCNGLKKNNIEYDFAFFNGDCIDDPANKEQATEFMKVVHKAVGGASKPLFYIRGNHEIRNAYSMELPELLDYPGGKTYGAFSWGDTRFVILDCGEDKPDEHWVYYGLNDFTALRADQAEFLKKELAGAEFKGAAQRVLLHHIPTFGNTDEYQPCRDLWNPILSGAPFSIALNAHTHEYVYHPVGSCSNNYPVYVGGGPKLDNATVAVIEKKGDKFSFKVYDAQGRLLR